MRRNEKLMPQQRPRTVPRTGGIDTSLLYEDFRRQFQESKMPVNTDFRALVSWVKLGDQRTHLIHTYPAKLLAHIAHFFVRASILSGAGARVLDPFCGSGTVALEVSMSGCQALVADANPMAQLLTRVKTTPYSPEKLLTGLMEILRRARRYRTAPEVEIVNSTLWGNPPEKKRSSEVEFSRIGVLRHEEVKIYRQPDHRSAQAR